MTATNSPQPYTGQAMIYLDQNVLDMAVKGYDPEFFTSLSEPFQIIYSDDTLREIKRSNQPEKISSGTGYA